MIDAEIPTDAEILNRIADLVRNKLDWQGSVEPSMGLVADLNLDSIRLLTLAMEVEDQFRIYLEEEDEAAIRTVGDLVSLIRRKLEENT